MNFDAAESSKIRKSISICLEKKPMSRANPRFLQSRMHVPLKLSMAVGSPNLGLSPLPSLSFYSATTMTMETRKSRTSNSFKQRKNSDHAAQFLGRFFTSLDWNSNVISALIPKIFAPSRAIVATSISLEIPNVEAQQSKCST